MEADVGVQVTLVHVCGMTREEAGEGGDAAALLSALPHGSPASGFSLPTFRGGELPQFHRWAAANVQSTVYSTYSVEHIGHAFPKGFYTNTFRQR